MPFSDPTPLLEFLTGGHWRVAASFRYTTPDGRIVVEVPEGFDTDLASVPRPLWPLLAPQDGYAPAAIVHDRLYRDHQVNGQAVTRAQADGVMLAAMGELGIGWLRRWTIYCAVRLGAWWAWD